MIAKEQVESLQVFQRRLHLLIAFGFEPLHMVIQNAIAHEPEHPRHAERYYHFLHKMWDAVKEAKATCTLETDSAIRGPAGTTPGQWVTEVLLHIDYAEHVLSGAYNLSPHGPATPEILEAHARGKGDGRIEWDDPRESVYSTALVALRRELHRTHAWLEVLRLSGAKVARPVCEFDDARKTITYKDETYDLRDSPRSYRGFKAIYEITYEKGGKVMVTGDDLSELLTGTKGVRWDRVLNAPDLPEALARCIQSQPGKGYWFVQTD